MPKGKYDRKQKPPAEKLIAGAQAKIAEGLTDETAKACITAGIFVVVSDLSYRGYDIGSQLLPEIVQEINEIGKVNPAANAETAVTELFSIAKNARGPFASIQGIKQAYTSITKAFNQAKSDIEKAGSVDIKIADSKGLWDFRITAMGFGLLSSGLALYIANHPELVERAFTEMGAAMREARQMNLEMYKSLVGMEGEVGKAALKMINPTALK